MDNHKSGGKEDSESKKKNNGGCLLFVLLIICVATVVLAWKFRDKSGTADVSATVQITQTTETESETKDPLEIILSGDVPSSHNINIEAVLQNPELPTGCEITSLTTVLNYWGYDVDKCDLADNYLHKESGGGEYTMYEAFLGTPYDSNAFGCYAPVIKDAAEKYMARQSKKMQVADISGNSVEKVYACVAQGYPVVIWSTMNLHEPSWTTYWTNEDGTKFEFPSYEHCMVINGYNKNDNTVEVCDPMEGNTTYEMDRFEEIYKEMGSQAVLLYK